MFIPTGSVIVALGIYMITRGRKNMRRLKKYEQENRSSDGTVQFDDIESQRTHGANKNLCKVIMALGFFAGVFGLIFIGYGLDIFTHP
jgi:hypothetical protein